MTQAPERDPPAAAPLRHPRWHRRESGSAAAAWRTGRGVVAAAQYFLPGPHRRIIANCTVEVVGTAEEFYRERWRHDKEVRSTHGVNCTGSCSWKVYVKDGIITWDTQQTDYPSMGRRGTR